MEVRAREQLQLLGSDPLMQSFATNDICNMRSIKLRQSSKIQRLGETLIAAGFVTLDDQAKVLGIPRSTAWTILRGAHKGSGLSAATINCMINSPKLPWAVRIIILEYVEEKTGGLYGHTKSQLRRFKAKITTDAQLDFAGRTPLFLAK